MSQRGADILNILSAEKISKSYSEKILFNDLTIGISEGEKICLIGINGTGKSTLLKVLAGAEYPDSGAVTSGNNVKIEYLSQSPDFSESVTVLEYVFRAKSPIMSLIRDYEYALAKIHENPDDVVWSKKLMDLSHKMDMADAWTVESEAKNILTRLGITNFEAKVDTLSGGQKKRVAMASALISPSDLLILDEPTNHIDNDTVDWLEKYLNKRTGALLMVTHDRYFLERVANRIIELESGKLSSYQANYSNYLEMRIQREELAQTANVKKKNLIKSELEWIRRGAQARSTKQKARIDRFEQMSETYSPIKEESIEIQTISSRMGKKTIEINHVSKGFDGHLLISDFTHIFHRNDRIGIIGPNGSGKSTLLKIIAGKIQADSGKVEVGETVKISYFSQESEEMNSNTRVIDYIKEAAEFIETKDGSISASQMLERFLFPPEAQWAQISKLSGGEKRRLYLLRVLSEAPNIILLDEPTNDFDIQTLSILEDYLEEFPGAVAVVSHDRFFLDRVAKRIFSFEASGKVREYVGNYSDYAEKRDANLAEEKKAYDVKRFNVEKNTKASSRLQVSNITKAEGKDKPIKLSYNEQREFEQIDDKISEIENNINKIKVKIAEASSDFTALSDSLAKLADAELELQNAMERWVYLTELNELSLKK